VGEARLRPLAPRPGHVMNLVDPRENGMLGILYSNLQPEQSIEYRTYYECEISTSNSLLRRGIQRIEIQSKDIRELHRLQPRKPQH